MRLIDSDKIVNYHVDCTNGESYVLLPVKSLSEIPTVDAVPVVRCKDCKHRVSVERFEGEYGCNHENGLLGLVYDNYFCSYGERKDSENENKIQTNKN